MVEYDLIIIGAGPAGLSAAICAARYKLKTIVIGKEIGGYVSETPLIENYPGFREISGTELTAKFKEQVKALDIEIKEEDVKEVKKTNKEFEVITDKSIYKGKFLILALGSKRRKLNVKGEDTFTGKGITYCVTCDAPLFKDKDIAIIGAGDSAVIAAIEMLPYAKKIYMIDIEEKPRAKPLGVEQLKKEAKNKLQIISSHKVNEIKGNKFISSIEIEQVQWKGKEFKAIGKKKELKVQGVIIEIGMIPSTDIAKQLGVKLNEQGFIKTDKEMRTNIQGIFAAGDIIAKPLRQIITAASDGAIAASSAYSYLKEKK